MTVDSRLLKVGRAAMVTMTIVVTAAFILWRVGSVAHSMSGQPEGDSLIADTEGEVWAIEPTTNTILVRSKPAGLGAIPLVVTNETQVLIGNKEGGFSDLHEGMHVKVAYVRSGNMRLARYVVVSAAEGVPSAAIASRLNSIELTIPQPPQPARSQAEDSLDDASAVIEWLLKDRR